jgi:CMP-N-acetylneuraminic acid synthetase
MKIVAFIPIKLRNERMPNKNIRSFTNGKPLLTYVLETLARTQDIEDVYVYCSQDSIIGYLPERVKFLKRPESLDSPQANGTEIIRHFVEDVKADVYVMSHATSPFVSSASLDKGLNAVISGQYDSAFSVQRLQKFMWLGGKPVNYDPAHIPRSQDTDVYYAETDGFYIFTRALATEHGRRIGFTPLLVESSPIESIDIDYEEDFIIADAIFNSIVNNERKGKDGHD